MGGGGREGSMEGFRLQDSFTDTCSDTAVSPDLTQQLQQRTESEPLDVIVVIAVVFTVGLVINRDAYDYKKIEVGMPTACRHAGLQRVSQTAAVPHSTTANSGFDQAGPRDSWS